MAIENNPNVKVMSPFGAKTFAGLRIFARNKGAKFSVVSSGTTNCDFLVPYANTKITGLELIGGEIGDTVTLQVLDTEAGTLSGVPYYMLNEFATDINIPANFYGREAKYDADLIQNLTIRVVYTSISNKTIGINCIFHELKV